MLERKGRAQEQGNGPNWGSASFLMVHTWHLEGWLQTTESHKGEKQLTETGQGHFDV